MFAVFFYVRNGLSYRDLEEIMAERVRTVDHVTLNGFVGEFPRGWLGLSLDAIILRVEKASGNRRSWC